MTQVSAWGPPPSTPMYNSSNNVESAAGPSNVGSTHAFVPSGTLPYYPAYGAWSLSQGNRSSDDGVLINRPPAYGLSLTVAGLAVTNNFDDGIGGIAPMTHQWIPLQFPSEQFPSEQFPQTSGPLPLHAPNDQSFLGQGTPGDHWSFAQGFAPLDPLLFADESVEPRNISRNGGAAHLMNYDLALDKTAPEGATGLFPVRAVTTFKETGRRSECAGR